jgi:hypothetical protein
MTTTSVASLNSPISWRMKPRTTVMSLEIIPTSYIRLVYRRLTGALVHPIQDEVSCVELPPPVRGSAGGDRHFIIRGSHIEKTRLKTPIKRRDSVV